MRLTSFSDYALRVLMYAAAHEDRLITIDEVARVYAISRTHLMKVVNTLTGEGYLRAVRGRNGGLVLGVPVKDIGLGDVLRLTEPDFALVECFGDTGQCAISSCCRLRPILTEALGAFIVTLDRYTLADLMLAPDDFPELTAAK